MIGQLLMQGSNGNMAQLALSNIPEFIPPETEETDKDRVWADFSKPMTLEFTGTISYVSARSRKWWVCLSLYGNWTAKGPIRMRMLKKAAIKLKIDNETRAMYYG